MIVSIALHAPMQLSHPSHGHLHPAVDYPAQPGKDHARKKFTFTAPKSKNSKQWTSRCRAGASSEHARGPRVCRLRWYRDEPPAVQLQRGQPSAVWRAQLQPHRGHHPRLCHHRLQCAPVDMAAWFTPAASAVGATVLSTYTPRRRCSQALHYCRHQSSLTLSYIVSTAQFD